MTGAMSQTTPHLRPARSGRFALVAAIVLVVAFLLNNDAFASVVVATPVQNVGWYWSSNQDVRGCVHEAGVCPNGSVGGGVANNGGVKPIAEGHFGVSLKGGTSDMRGYLSFDLGNVPSGSKVKSFTVKITTSRPEDVAHSQEHQSNGQPAPATANPAAAAIDVCLVTSAFASDPAGDPPDAYFTDPEKGNALSPTHQEPSTDCSKQAGTATQAPDASFWTLDLTPAAQHWIDGDVFNNGVALFPHKAGTGADSWTIEFHGRYTESGDDPPKIYVSHQEEISDMLQYEPPPPEPEPTKSTTVQGTDVYRPPSFNNTTPPVTEPPAYTPPVPPTTPSGSSGTNQEAAAPVASLGRPVTPGYVWLLLPAGLAGMVGLSRAIGGEVEVEEAENRVAVALRRRRARDEDQS